MSSKSQDKASFLTAGRAKLDAFRSSKSKKSSSSKKSKKSSKSSLSSHPQSLQEDFIAPAIGGVQPTLIGDGVGIIGQVVALPPAVLEGDHTHSAVASISTDSVIPGSLDRNLNENSGSTQFHVLEDEPHSPVSAVPSFQFQQRRSESTNSLTAYEQSFDDADEEEDPDTSQINAALLPPTPGDNGVERKTRRRGTESPPSPIHLNDGKSAQSTDENGTNESDELANQKSPSASYAALSDAYLTTTASVPPPPSSSYAALSDAYLTTQSSVVPEPEPEPLPPPLPSASYAALSDAYLTTTASVPPPPSSSYAALSDAYLTTQSSVVPEPEPEPLPPPLPSSSSYAALSDAYLTTTASVPPPPSSSYAALSDAYLTTQSSVVPEPEPEPLPPPPPPSSSYAALSDSYLTTTASVVPEPEPEPENQPPQLPTTRPTSNSQIGQKYLESIAQPRPPPSPPPPPPPATTWPNSSDSVPSPSHPPLAGTTSAEDAPSYEELIDQLTREKFDLQRGLESQLSAMDNLVTENENLTEQYNAQGARLSALQEELTTVRESAMTLAATSEMLVRERDGAKAASAAAIERSQQLAAEVIQLEETVLKLKSEKLRRERMTQQQLVAEAFREKTQTTPPPPPHPLPQPQETERVVAKSEQENASVQQQSSSIVAAAAAAAAPSVQVERALSPLLEETVRAQPPPLPEELRQALAMLPDGDRRLAESILSVLEEMSENPTALAEENARLKRRLGAATQALELAEARARGAAASTKASSTSNSKSPADDSARVPLVPNFVTRLLAPPPTAATRAHSRVPM
ncbi:hypothetical protein PPROV_000485300 [Pycnococcus provasolii]|uniref:Uncharacterized protein n=1 Tax=Pycnococcus provasolii TaxID=41880 RepID=A0A830HFK2_9CHLO|nr:hypothetical protein PPROV_000485300 [Pycnococcus provasolii]